MSKPAIFATNVLTVVGPKKKEFQQFDPPFLIWNTSDPERQPRSRSASPGGSPRRHYDGPIEGPESPLTPGGEHVTHMSPASPSAFSFSRQQQAHQAVAAAPHYDLTEVHGTGLGPTHEVQAVSGVEGAYDQDQLASGRNSPELTAQRSSPHPEASYAERANNEDSMQQQEDPGYGMGHAGAYHDTRPASPSYTVHYIGVAQGELGILSKKQVSSTN